MQPLRYRWQRPLALLCVAATTPIQETIELVTVPKSQAVQLTIYNSAEVVRLHTMPQQPGN